MPHSSQPTAGRLIICPTPIGNLGDITQRVKDALQQADVVCAEDTRVTGKLLAAYAIRKPIERLDENLMGDQASSIVDRVAAGETVAYCSDAGMPGVSDPGSRLVAKAREAKVPVEVLPGPSAADTAYVASGFTNPRFYFGGFFPRKEVERTSVLASLKQLDAVLIFYESPNRLVSALGAIAETFPYRRIAICRELTKLHEEVVCGLATEVFDEFRQRAALQPIKGEIVIVIDGPADQEMAASREFAIEQAKAKATELVSQGMRTKVVAKWLAAEFDIPRNQAYQLAVEASSTASSMSSKSS